MNALEIKAELSVRMLQLEKAIDNGMPYSELKRIYTEIKDLQLKCIMADVEQTDPKPQPNNIVIE